VTMVVKALSKTRSTNIHPYASMSALKKLPSSSGEGYMWGLGGDRPPPQKKQT